ncbi:hypothetical protein [Streptomyces sp. NBC_00370]|uniref:hypothetical protein n=1 Tax=Streptomyces sp. NBC_00370 TaxID=2975728 RepID=UPI002E2596A7
MITTSLYEIETHEGDDGTMHPAEQIWIPSTHDAADSGFVTYRGLHIAGIDDPSEDRLYPAAFIFLGKSAC